MVLEVDKLFLIWSNDPKNMVKRLTYTKHRNRCNKLIFKSRNEYDRQNIINCNNNIRKLWDRINTLLGNKKQTLDTLILSNMKDQGSEKQICNKFANTFSNEIISIKHTCGKKFLDRNNYVQKKDVCMRWQPVSCDHVKRIIMKMDSKKSPGSDRMRMSDLKFVADQISPIISKLINLSVQHALFPNKLKEAIVRPIYKKGSRKEFSNYRPIAILPSVDKIIEKCIVEQLAKYLKNNNILNECQHGFQKGKSTGTLLSNFTDEINTHLNEKKFVVAVFFDYKKAFDTLESETLLNAMEECGLGGQLNDWFCDYLTSRSYRVRVGEAYSDTREVSCGVPQGSGCAPTCYLMHVNSLCGVLRHCSGYMYADDLCILLAGTDFTETCRLVQQDVDAVVRWSHDNGILLNTDKTKLLVIHSPYLCPPDTPHSIVSHSYDCHHNSFNNCACIPVERVNNVTYLGMKIDKSFSWSDHIDYICTKLRVLLSKFYHLSHRIPLNTLKCLYMALVDSILSYALDSYGLTFKTNLDKLEALQIRFLKLLVNKKTKDKCDGDYKQLFKICKILPVSLKHKYLLAVNNHGRRECHSLVVHRHNTRSISAGKYFVPKVSNYFGDRTLNKRIPFILNSLPQNIRLENNLKKFSSLLKSYLLDSYK